MAFDQSKAFIQLEKLVKDNDKENFFFDFMLAFNTPRSTVTKLKKNIGSDVSSSGGEYLIKNKIHFKQVSRGTDLHAECDFLKSLSSTSKEKIRFTLVTDFLDVVAYDTRAKALLDVEFVDLHKNYAFFLPLAGIEKYELTDEHPADIKAAYKLGQLCDVIRRHNEINSPERVHALNVFLTRLLFCFYAEDTGIFSDNQFINALQNTTDKNGSDLDSFFEKLFLVFNLPNDSEKRRALPTHFASFEYVNGGLFASHEWIPKFTDKARRMIIEAGYLEWDQINPDILGSMFQSVIEPEQRGRLGQHYTSVPNIMKVIQPLFLDGLEEALDKAKTSSRKLQELLIRIQRIRIFDSACGSGNFLIIAYKELRKFEMKVLKALDALGKQSEIFMSGITLTQFYGIEIDDFAHEIALLSLWLAENQMNKMFKAEFGHSEPMLPLKDSGNVIHDNALRLDWEQVCPKMDKHGDLEVYVCGNPPFVSFKERAKSEKQTEDMAQLFSGYGNWKQIDYVGAWFFKGAKYIKGGNAKLALVATNSVIQGDQVSLLWGKILQEGIKIEFGYTSFSWSNNAKDKAAVHVTIIGLSNNPTHKAIYSSRKNDEVVKVSVKNVSPYLVDASDLFITPVNKPISKSAKTMKDGNNYTKSASLFVQNEEKEEIESEYPELSQYIKKIIGADEFLNGKLRYCFWLVDYELSEKHPYLEKRIQACKQERLGSTKRETREIASKTPHLFPEVRQPKTGKYLVVPRVTSERRKYVPIDILPCEIITTNQVLMVDHADVYDFSILTSEMHNDWMRTVAGRLESRYRYSATLVYNTFPWPEVSETQKEQISTLGEEILLTRADYPDKTLAQLYDPDKMPEPLRQAHRELDLAVEQLYRVKPFEDAAERVAFLFKRYEQLINIKEGNNA
ncbi:class I SAM-dependent DNA methyltransferase [Vibrio sp. CAIM 722]|uniref:site-specific DNA-methyltransferase (adenine-specific) n=1 Tax=Vibrio eleionomae TaxID=2653505 RepID=A0A7X4RW28_9VIBR|nr:DNA methyltransferase [Vibrio eleionomae]MZI94749.1 class I SAM-dependent DNA methyltransferase [Vibrio eleionomae]